MHNAYVSSTLYALRSKGYLSFPFNDYYLLNDRRNQTQCCSCCGFSSHSSCKLPIHKSCYYVYGPRQSSLLQWSAYRKLLYRDRDRYCGYYYFDYCCNGSPIDVSCCVNESVVCRRRSTVKCRCRVVGDEGDYGRVCDDDDTEVLLSLLGDGGVGKRRNQGLYRRVELKGGERDSGTYRRGSGDGVCECGKRRNGRFESTRIESREEGKRSDGKRREGVSRGENRRSRSESLSSYYSVSSSGDFNDYDDDDESKFHDKHTLSAEETLSGSEDFTGKVEKHKEASELRNIEFVGSVEVDRRKKSEKQRSDRVAEEARRSEISASHERFNGVEAETSRKHYAQIDNRVGEASSSRRKFVENTEIQKINQDESKRTSLSQVRVDHNEENAEEAKDERRRIARYRTEEDIKSNTQRNSEVRDYYTQRTSISQNRAEIGEYRKNDVSSSHTSQETSARRNSQQAVRISEIHDTTTNIANTSVTDSRVNVSNRVNNADSISVSLGTQTSQRPSQRVQSGGQESDARRNSQQAIRISKIHDTTNIENTSILESRVNVSNQVNDTNLISVSLAPQISQRPPQRVESGGQETIRISEIHDMNFDNTSMVQSQVNISNQVDNMNLISVSHQGYAQPPRPQMIQRPPRRVQSYNVDETASIVDSRVASETRLRQESAVGTTISGNNRVSGNLRPIRPGNELEEASSSRERSRTGYRARIEKGDVEEGIQSQSSQTMVMPPRSQSLTRSSVRDELESGFESERQRMSNTTLESSSGYSTTPAIDMNQDSHERTERLETPGEPPLYLDAPEDALGSNDRLQQSSARIVGEFVEAFSSSEIVASRDDNNRQEALTEPKKEDERTSLSGGSGTTGPSAEMWDLTVTAPSVIRTPKADEESETVTTMPTTENALIVKRSGRSLWNIIADIVTLKWGPRTEPSPTPRSSRRITSNESAGSETWLSTQQSVELSRGDNSKGSRSESKSDHLQVTGLSTPGQATESDRFTDQTRYTEAEESPSPPTTRVASGSINLGWNEDGKSSKASPPSSGMEMVESPLRPTIRGESSTVITSQVSVGAKMEINPAVVETSLLPESSSGSELKRRKLQRIKQVPKDRFDEWEEAFTIETEQRRLDEMFMREALVEAKKAADTWEVPVGAVLVHNGTVIARGYNLVEELRDSTAHAEMICIREASNQLRSWRLSDTTLYVTLEPCPMCAGAILQARVPNLVWGAPNKLLGADGSWIRLFPDGGEGGNRSEVLDKPAPPPHPFHPKMNIRRGVLATECSEVMQQFFQLRRKKKEIAAAESPTSRPSSSHHHPSKLLKKMHDVFHITFCL